MNSLQLVQIEEKFREYLRPYHSVLVALSGGVDSSVLLALTQKVFSKKIIAATGVSQSLKGEDLIEIHKFCRAQKVALFEVPTDELNNDNYVKNQPDRCYFCKQELYQKLNNLVREQHADVILDGTHVDDLMGHRPGHKAAREQQVKSPFVDLGVGKADIRAFAANLNLPQKDKPASPCLSSRIAYGVEVNTERLLRVRDAEDYLHELGLLKCRVRLHDTIARIEVPTDDFPLLMKHQEPIQRYLKSLGFTYVTLDLGGMRSGSLLEVFQ